MGQGKAAEGLFERLSAALKTEQGDDLKSKVKVGAKAFTRLWQSSARLWCGRAFTVCNGPLHSIPDKQRNSCSDLAAKCLLTSHIAHYNSFLLVAAGSCCV